MSKAKQSVGSEIAKILRADLLPNLLAILESFPALRSMLPQVLQLAVVIDANVVYGELRWRLKKRPRPNLRSSLEEALASHVLIAYAPHHLDDEIHEHMEEIAADTKQPVETVTREWKAFRSFIHFHTGRKGAGGRVSDPDDAAYLDTLQEVAVRGIYTRDTHFQDSAAPLVFVAMDMRNPMDGALRRYARATAVRVGLSMGSSVSAVVSVEALIALGRLLKAFSAAFKRLSSGAQLLILAGVTAVILHPKSRAKLKELWEAFQETVRPLLWDAVVEAMYEFAEATETAEVARREIEVLLPAARRRPLIAHARAVCLASSRPLSEETILRRVRTNGYVSRNGGSAVYLRRLLRADGKFVESAMGWSHKSRTTT
ncbi:MAG: hypothetical protein PW792_08595 [Acidobacteriaceae bacterium]|nr:hypothetical protein [Acidobacteriaceae bacterium]